MSFTRLDHRCTSLYAGFTLVLPSSCQHACNDTVVILPILTMKLCTSSSPTIVRFVLACSSSPLQYLPVRRPSPFPFDRVRGCSGRRGCGAGQWSNPPRCLVGNVVDAPRGGGTMICHQEKIATERLTTSLALVLLWDTRVDTGSRRT